MIAILLTIINIIFVILIVLPLRILLRVIQKIDDKRATAQLKRYQIEYQVGQEIIQQYKEEDRTLEMRSIQLRLKTKIISLKTRIKLRRSTIRFLRFLLTIFQFSSVFSGVFVSLLVGTAILVSLNMSTLIPVWQLSLGTSQQTQDKSDKTEDKSDDSKKDDSNKQKSPNEAVSSFLLLRDKHHLKPVWANAFVGNFMEETGGGTYKFNVKDDSQNGMNGGLGIVQWTDGRASILRAKKNYDTIEVQIDYVMEEIRGVEKPVGDYIDSHPDISLADATRYIAQHYERCGAAYVEKRIPNAEKFQKDYISNKQIDKYKP